LVGNESSFDIRAPVATVVAARSSAADRLESDAGLPSQRTLPASRTRSAETATVLVADPGRDTRELLSAGLLRADIGRVLEAESIAAVDDIIDSGVGGQLALVSLAFGTASSRLIHGLRAVPWQRVIALAPTADPDPVVGALQAGACGVLRGYPGTPFADLPRMVNELSEREIEVLRFVADGRSNKWIGEELSLSALTVKSHLARISRKLGTGDRSHLVAIALRAGLIH